MGNDLTKYVIKRANAPIRIDGVLDEEDWKACKSVGDFKFPWHKQGEKEQTVTKLLWDDEYLYVSYYPPFAILDPKNGCQSRQNMLYYNK